MSRIKVSGGIFFALLSEIKITNDNRSIRMNGVEEVCTNVDLLHELGAIIGKRYTETDIVKKTASAYRTCEGQGGLDFNTSRCGDDFNNRMLNHYDILLKRTEAMLQKYIVNKESDRKNFISKVLFFISKAVNIDDAYFYYNNPNKNKPLSLHDFVNLKEYEFAPFVLAVWQSLIFNCNNNKVARDTFLKYFYVEYSKSEYLFKEEYLKELNTEFKVKNILSPAVKIDFIDIEEERESPLIKDQSNTDYYSKYLINCVEKNRKLKTILFPKQPVDFYNIYVCNDVCLDTDFRDQNKDENNPLVSATPKSLIDRYGRFLTLSAPGGYGKSMFLKHMLLCENTFKDADWMKETGLVPILLTLKDFKNSHRTIDDFIFEKMKKYDQDLDFDIIKKDFSNGIFLFLFDALDEIDGTLLDDYISKFNDFTNQYDSNVFILSSRPNNVCNSLTNFTSLKLMFFRQQQGIKLINHFTQYPKERIELFNKKVFQNPNLRYDSSSIECNPLLLTIKFMVYMQTNKLLKSGSAEFFDAAYEALYITHDQIHSQYSKRVYKTGLDLDQLKEAISEFCYLSYFAFKYSFTRNEIDDIVADMKTSEKYQITTSAFIKDLKDNLSLFVLEDGKYSFIHRNFQQYFTAYYLSKQKKNFFNEELISSIDSYSRNRRNSLARRTKNTFLFFFFDNEISSVLDMLKQLKPEKIEKQLYLPILQHYLEPSHDFLKYLSEAYGEIIYGNGAVDSPNDNSPFSEILEYIINNELDDCYSSHELRDGPDYEEFAISYFYLNDAGDNLEEESEKRIDYDDDYGRVELDPDGIQYQVNPIELDINVHKDKVMYDFLYDKFKDEHDKLIAFFNRISK